MTSQGAATEGPVALRTAGGPRPQRLRVFRRM